MVTNFVVVDDDPINNMICSKIIRKVFPTADIQVFTDPEVALPFILSAYSQTGAPDTILFLDINMPTLTGWEFLEVFADFDESVKKCLKVYLLSSSIDSLDKERAARDRNVSNYIEKPLTVSKLRFLTDQF